MLTRIVRLREAITLYMIDQKNGRSLVVKSKPIKVFGLTLHFGAKISW